MEENDDDDDEELVLVILVVAMADGNMDLSFHRNPEGYSFELSGLITAECYFQKIPTTIIL